MKFSETRSARRKRKTFAWKVLESLMFFPCPAYPAENSQGTRQRTGLSFSVGVGGVGGSGWEWVGWQGVRSKREVWLHRFKSRPPGFASWPCSVVAAGPRTGGFTAAPLLRGDHSGCSEAPHTGLGRRKPRLTQPACFPIPPCTSPPGAGACAHTGSCLSAVSFKAQHLGVERVRN